MTYQRTTMTRKMSFVFAKYVEEHYKATGLNNVEFASKATKELPFPVTQTMVRTMIRDLDIAPNKVRNTAVARENVIGLTARVSELEAQVKRLAQSVRALAVRQSSLTDWDVNKEPVK